MEWVLKIFLFYIGFVGFWLVFGTWIKDFVSNMKRKKKVVIRLKKENDEMKIKALVIDKPVIAKLKLVIEIAHKNKITFENYLFVLFSILFFSILFLYGTQNLSVTNVLFSFLLLFFPLAYTVSSFYFSRVESSYEGERLIIEFINQYHMNNGNILETINKTSQELKKEVYSKIALNRLYFNLTNTRNSQDRERALYDFSFSIDTQWAKLLSHNILSALTLGVDISKSLEDILLEIKEIRNSLEKAKRDNNESFAIVIGLAPAIYLITTYYGIKSIGMSFSEYLTQQFTSDIGYRLIVIIAIVYAFALFLRKFLKRPKFD